MFWFMNFFVIPCEIREINWNGGGGQRKLPVVCINHQKNKRLPPFQYYYSRDSNKMIHRDHLSLFVISIDDNVHVHYYDSEL